MIDLIPNASAIGSMIIDWSKYTYSDKVFKIYRSVNNDKFEMIPIDYTQVTNVRCLQIYPHPSAENQIQEWMVDAGKNIIHAESESIENFNLDPESYLKENGHWKYDVVFFGSWNDNYNKDISDKAVEILTSYIKSGRGVIFGHDTLFYSVDNSSGHNKENFNKFANYVGVKLEHYPSKNSKESTKIIIAKKGLLTTYPWDLNSKTFFTIPSTHTSSQIVQNVDNVNFFLEDNYYPSNLSKCAYLTTKNNIALIQTGHSNGLASDDEERIIANTIFYCNQLMFSNCKMNDYGSIDNNAPKAPTIRGKYPKYILFAEDQGTTYSYYVESYSKDDTSEDGLIGRSKIASNTVTTGIECFYYTFDNTKSTTITLSNSEKTEDYFIKSYYKDGYLHVAAVDRAGNIGPTTTIEISKFIKTYIHKTSLRFSFNMYCIMLCKRCK